MDVKANDIEAIVRQVLENMKDAPSNGAANSAAKPAGACNAYKA